MDSRSGREFLPKVPLFIYGRELKRLDSVSEHGMVCKVGLDIKNCLIFEY
jgi:hypothetical protein